MDWSIQFYCEKNLNRLFIHKLLYFLVSRGVQYNAYKYEGAYLIFGKNPEKDIEYFEQQLNESTEKLAEIVETFIKFDLRTTSLSIHLDYLAEVKFHFRIDIAEIQNNKSFINFIISEYEIPDEKTFISFINFCKEVFDRFEIAFGAYRSEYMDDIPLDYEEFLKEKPNIVNFYSKLLVDKIGRERLLSAPAKRVEELENGGIMLLVCTNQMGCPDELDLVRNHLGY